MSCLSTGKPGSNHNVDVVEVVVGGEVVRHVGEDHAVLEDGEDWVDARLTVVVVAPVEVQGGGHAGEVCHQEIFLQSQRFPLYTGAGAHTVAAGGGENTVRKGFILFASVQKSAPLFTQVILQRSLGPSTKNMDSKWEFFKSKIKL